MKPATAVHSIASTQLPYNETISGNPQQKQWTKKSCSSRNANLIMDYHDLSLVDLFKMILFWMVFPYYSSIARKRVKIILCAILYQLDLKMFILLITFPWIAILPILNHTHWISISKFSIMIIRGLQTSFSYVTSRNQVIHYLQDDRISSVPLWINTSLILVMLFTGNMTAAKHTGHEFAPSSIRYHWATLPKSLRPFFPSKGKFSEMYEELSDKQIC